MAPNPLTYERDPESPATSPLQDALERRFGASRAGALSGVERLARGRGSLSNSTGRFEPLIREAELSDDCEAISPKTEVTEEAARSIITRNDSPDLPFDRSINVYRGCEHGCFYCFARPSHAYLGLSPGLDFETKLFAKPNAASLLEKELSRASYKVKPMAMGTNTDPYQPIERRYGLTRKVLEVLEKTRHPVSIVTKSHLVTRDIDILARMAEHDLVRVGISITSLDRTLSRAMEPRASSPERRLAAVKALSEAGIPVGILVAPVIPALNDHEIERILEAASAQGAREAGYVMLRLPHELKQMVREWLVHNRPDAARHVLKQVQELHGGRDYSADFAMRQKGRGPLAWTYSRRFALAVRRFGLERRQLRLRCDLFRPPLPDEPQARQLSLF